MNKKKNNKVSSVSRRSFLKSTGMISSGVAFAGIASPLSCTNSDKSGNSGLRTAKDKTVCRVTCGALNDEDLQAVALALDDLRVFWEKAFGHDCFLLSDEQQDLNTDIDILIGNAENLEQIKALEEQRLLRKLNPVQQGFTLDIINKSDQRVAVLRAIDRLGLQYAVYCFAEQFLGVRFVHPQIDIQPESPPMPQKLHIEESPSVPLRILFDTSHVRRRSWGTESRKSHFSDSISWRWEDWAGNPSKLLRFIVWGVKNRANHVVFDDTLLSGAKATWIKEKPFMVSQAIWNCIDTRGLKMMAWCGPGYPWGAPEGAYKEEDMCHPTAARVGGWDEHLCTEKPGFWEEADAWLDILAEHRHRLTAIFANWQENVYGEGVTEGHPDGIIYNYSMSKAEMNSARFRIPVFAKGGGCPNCGHIENVERWNKHLDYMRDGAAARGLVPAGLGRIFWGMAEPDDAMVAEQVVPHLPPGSVSTISCLPGTHSPKRIEAWPRLVDKMNDTDGGDRRVIVHQELFYSCGTDVPIVPFTNLDRIDDHFSILGKYKSFAGFLGGVYVYHSMGWLLTLYALRKQWQPTYDWNSWVRDFFHGLLGPKAIGILVEVILLLKDVQTLEGLQPGEEPRGYYSLWALNISQLAPESLPRWGPLNDVVVTYRDSFVRLVKKGARDKEKILTSESCALVDKRSQSMMKKLEQALEMINILIESLPADLNTIHWDDLIISPLKVTARFLQSRILVVQSYMVYIRMREFVLSGRQITTEPEEGLSLCRQSLDAQNEYASSRPGFSWIYPMEINPATLKQLIILWKKLAGNPQLCADMDVCAFLDKAETEAEKITLREV